MFRLLFLFPSVEAFRSARLFLSDKSRVRLLWRQALTHQRSANRRPSAPRWNPGSTSPWPAAAPRSGIVLSAFGVRFGTRTTPSTTAIRLCRKKTVRERSESSHPPFLRSAYLRSNLSARIATLAGGCRGSRWLRGHPAFGTGGSARGGPSSTHRPTNPTSRTTAPLRKAPRCRAAGGWAHRCRAGPSPREPVRCIGGCASRSRRHKSESKKTTSSRSTNRRPHCCPSLRGRKEARMKKRLGNVFK